MKTIVTNLRDQVRFTEQDHKERMNRHREDIEWNKEECILLRAGLQENEDRTAELFIRGQQMARQLCHCADCQGPPISAVGSLLPPPYKRSPSLEFHTLPIEVCLIYDASTATESPVPFSDAENIPPACCANPPSPRAPLQPIEEVVSDAEDSNVVAERLEDQIGDEITLHFLNGSNQGRGARHRAVRANGHHSAPYLHCMQAGEHCSQPRSFVLKGECLQQ